MKHPDKPSSQGGRSTRAGASGRAGPTPRTDRTGGKGGTAGTGGTGRIGRLGPLELAEALRTKPPAAKGAKARPDSPKADPAAATVPREVRLIGGVWKRSKLPVADRAGLRPTPDRVRETLFNWLGQDLTGWRVLDAFAGSGALGFEAASRGAAQVVLLENDGELIKSLNASRLRLAATQLSIYRGEALTWMRASPAQFDLVLLDPPFAADLSDAALAAARPRLASGGLIYLEADRTVPAEVLAALSLEPWRSARAGRVHYQLLRAAVQAGPGEAAPGEAASASASTPPLAKLIT